ncbi:MAG: Formate dehydrogenase subunit alpha precursor [Syntrophaceae bacterium PtaU1.Bin231]|nr:MAG: Formate dehydrogenase subunit alpha precursor [Syntrophaceae bacterium PtaU1.Bin231]
MEITRRGFLTLSGTIGSGIALSTLGLDLSPLKAHAADITKMDRLRAARQVTSVCCYCSVGCGVVCSVDRNTGKVFNLEGDGDHPINEGSLCAKGAGLFDLTEANKYRLQKVLYRGPGGTDWEEKSWDWALPRIARLVKDARDKGFVKRNAKGELVNRAETIAHLGSSNVDNEECWLMTAKARALGMVYIDHQARV